MIEIQTKTNNIADKLKDPFKSIHFRPKTCFNGNILLLAYLDSRDVMKRLDDVVGIDGWSRDYKVLKNNLFCGITINGVTKWDCGTESQEDAEKGESSDAFKRAAVNWGIGRYLYYLPNMWVKLEQSGDVKINIQDKKTKEWLNGYYNLPTLPKWAYPKEEK